MATDPREVARTTPKAAPTAALISIDSICGVTFSLLFLWLNLNSMLGEYTS